MRILLVSEPMREGVGRHIVDLACGLLRHGHEVHLIYSPLRLDPGFLARLEAERGLTLVPLAMRRAPGPGDLPALMTIATYIWRHGPFDVLHAHSSKAGALLRIAGLWSRARMIYTAHAFVTMSSGEFGASARAIFRWIEWALAFVSDRIVCTAAVERQHAIETIGIAEKRLVVVHNCVAVEDFRTESDLRRELGLDPGTPLIGFIGRLDQQKGADIALRAMPGVLAVRPNARLVLMGAGSQDAELRALAATLGITPSVHFMGRMPARSYFHNFDVVVCPSRYDGFAYTPIEALYSGIPLVCSPVGGVLEIIEDGVNGLLVPVEDETATGEAVARLLCDAVLNQRIRVAARRTGGHFTLDHMIGELLEVYQGSPGSTALPAVETGGR